MRSRYTALMLAGLFGFRLVAVGGGLVCTAHGSDTPGAEHSHHEAWAGHEDDTKPASHDTPEVTECCAAMASCSVVFAAGTVRATSAAPSHRGSIQQVSNDLNVRPHTPDPPPPKS